MTRDQINQIRAMKAIAFAIASVVLFATGHPEWGAGSAIAAII